MMLHDFNYFGINVYIAHNSDLIGIWYHDGLQTALMAIKVKFDLRFEIHNFNYHGIHVHIAFNSLLSGLRGHGGLQMAPIASEVKFYLRYEISNLFYPGIHVLVDSNNHFGGLWGYVGLQMTSEAKYDLGFELSEPFTEFSMCFWPFNASFQQEEGG